jgi:hypothetical protein
MKFSRDESVPWPALHTCLPRVVRLFKDFKIKGSQLLLSRKSQHDHYLQSSPLPHKVLLRPKRRRFREHFQHTTSFPRFPTSLFRIQHVPTNDVRNVQL